VLWIESLKWLGVSTAFLAQGPDHLIQIISLVSGNRKTREKLAVIWFSKVWIVWKARNAMIFSQKCFDWEQIVEDAKIYCRKIH
jgi:hypothetical protein